MSAIPKPLNLAQINGLKSDALNYEAHRKTIMALNDLIAYLLAAQAAGVLPAVAAKSKKAGKHA